MRALADRPTALCVLFAAGLGLLVSLALARAPLPLALGVGVGLALLIAAVASTELALYLLVFSMLLGPEAIVGELGVGSRLGRGITLRADDFLVVVLGLGWLAKSALNKELGLVFRTPLNLPIAAYASAAAFATGLGMIAGRVSLLAGSLFLVKYFEYFVVYFMVGNNLRDRAQLARFLQAMLVTAFLVSLIGISQIPSGVRVSAPFEGESGEPNTLGGYLVLMLALVGGLFATSRSAARRVLLLALGGVLLLPLLFTLSRASYVALIPAALVLLAWGERRAVLAATLAGALVLAALALPQAVVDRVLYTFTQETHPEQLEVGGLRLDTSTSQRLEAWRESLLVDFPRHPVFGHGVSGFRFLDSQYPLVLGETGLVGLLAFLWLQAALFRQGRQVFRAARDPLDRGVALGLLAGLAGLVAHSLGTNTFIIVRIMEPFWFLAGMVMAIPRLEAGPPTGEGQASRAPRSASSARSTAR